MCWYGTYEECVWMLQVSFIFLLFLYTLMLNILQDVIFMLLMGYYRYYANIIILISLSCCLMIDSYGRIGCTYFICYAVTCLCPLFDISNSLNYQTHPSCHHHHLAKPQSINSTQHNSVFVYHCVMVNTG